MDAQAPSPANPLPQGNEPGGLAGGLGVEWRRWIAVALLLGLLAASLTTLTEPIPRWFAAGALVTFLGLTLFRVSSPAPSPLHRPADGGDDGRRA